MKAIILAAGRGSRLSKYTKDLPKGMLSFAGKTLIERQIDTLRNAGLIDIVIVTGYKANKIAYKNIKCYHNSNYSSTNMVESLFCASSELNDDLILSYADIIYEPEVLTKLIQAPHQVVITVDKDWKNYWLARYGNFSTDTESLLLNQDGSIRQLGEEDVGLDKIDARYVGLMKFSKAGVDKLKQVYYKNKKLFWNKPWQISKKVFQQAYTTDLIQALIDSGIQVQTLQIKGGWLEFDTNEDYENYLKWKNSNTLNKFINLEQNNENHR